jgi:hypothetical protein
VGQHVSIIIHIEEEEVNNTSHFDETKFIHKTGDVMTGDLVVESTSRIIFQNCSTQ